MEITKIYFYSRLVLINKKKKWQMVFFDEISKLVLFTITKNYEW